MRAKNLLPLVKLAASDWKEDKASRLAAALAYYTALSLAPLLVIIVAILGLVFGEQAARGELVTEFRGMLGTQGAAAIEAILSASSDKQDGIVATVIGTLVLLVGASGVFGELQAALDTIWEVAPKPGRGLRGVIKDRFFSFTMVLSVAFLLLVSLVITAALTAAGSFMRSSFDVPPLVWQLVNQVVSLAVTTGLFAIIFKYVPDVKVPWRDVWVGALATAVLFTLGKYLIGLYLGRSAAASAYGAAGSLVAMLVWVYYSAQILFFGAELTQAYATLHGSRVVTKPNAMPEGERSAVPDEVHDHPGGVPSFRH